MPSPSLPPSPPAPLPASAPIPSAAEQPVALREKLAFGGGAFAEKLVFDTDKQLANPIYNATLGVDPGLVGLGLALPRLWDAFSDPVIGVLSDKARSRFGRRRPFIFVGALLTAGFFVALWSVPRGLSTTFYFIYFVGLSLAFYTAAAVWSIPFQALGYELATTYHERTRVQGFRAFFNALGNLCTPWIFYLTQLPVFGGTMHGLQIVTTILGVLILVFGMLPALLIRERPPEHAVARNRLSVLRNVGATLRSGPFRLLLGTVVLVQIGGYMVAGLGFYVASYHMFAGDLKESARFLALYGTVFNGMVLVASPLAVPLARRLGKHRAFLLCCGLGFAGSVLKWVCFSSAWPYLAFLVPVLLAPGYACSTNLLFNSMVADICDVDELESGLRREGAYGAVGQWVFKLGQSLSLLISGLIVTLAGFELSRGARQSAETLVALRACFAFVPALAFLGGFLLIRRYSITEETALAVRNQLAARRS